ncbi:MAG: hypothetical protein PVH47_00805, partial [Thiohalocapsa sp.]
FRRAARLSRPIAALQLLAKGPAIPRRRALLADTMDAPRLPKNPGVTGIDGNGPLKMKEPENCIFRFRLILGQDDQKIRVRLV